MDDGAGFLPLRELQRLFDVLSGRGYVCIGPTLKDGAIQYIELSRAEQLPVGFRQSQRPGEYRIEELGDERCFAWANGPQALKPLSFAPEEHLWRSYRGEQGLTFQAVVPEPSPTAVIGVRACDLAALRLQVAHFQRGSESDPAFARRHAALFLIGVDCGHPAETCFCASTGDGPAVTQDYDLRLHELDEGFLLWQGTQHGAEILAELGLAAPTAEQLRRAEQDLVEAAAQQSRRLPAEDALRRLYDCLDCAHWSEIAERCLSCGNCTAVCPTCFCSSYESRPGLDGVCADQIRLWDSCFHHDHSVMQGRAVRSDTRQRYRQWLTHKLAGWQEQYGRSGCVGCGRCISWCPVGIDLTVEVPRLLEEGTR